MGYWATYDAVVKVDEATRAMLHVAGVFDGFRGAHYGDLLPTVILPSDLQAKADALNLRYDSLAALVAPASPHLSPGFLAGWGQLLTRWKFTYAGMSSGVTAWLSQFVNPRAADDQLTQFSDDYNATLVQFQRETGQQIVAAPSPTPPATTESKVEKVIYITAAIATIVSVGYLINAAKK